MTATASGSWIDVKPSDVLTSDVSSQDKDGIQSTPSPYDIPVAVRINEGDPDDPAYSVELRYLGGLEQTRSHGVADVAFEVGTRSGRVYRVLIDSKRALEGGREDLHAVKRAIERLTSQVSSHKHVWSSTNYLLVRQAVLSHEDELVTQLHHLGQGKMKRR